MDAKGSKFQKEDLALLFTFLTTIVGIWVFILIYIIDSSKPYSINYNLTVLATIHYLLFLLLLANMLLVFIAGLDKVSFLNRAKLLFNKQRINLKDFVYTSWLPIVSMSIISYTINHIISYKYKDVYR